MKIIALSDSHGNASAIQDAITSNRDTDIIIFCGDGYDDIRQIQSMYSDKMLIAVKGNCDWFCPYPDTRDLTVAGKKIFVTHGHLFGVKEGYQRIINLGHQNHADILIFGHTHAQMCSVEGSMILLNPGSCSHQIRYAVINIDENSGKTTVTEYPPNSFGTLTV